MNCTKCGKWAGAYAGFPKDHDLCVCPKSKKEWQGLTDERIGELERKHLFSGKNGEAPEEFEGEMGYWAVYRAIESELREKNT